MHCSSINDVTSKSHEQRLITKEHIVMHTHLIIWLYTLVQGIAEILHFRTLQTLAHACCSNILARNATVIARGYIANCCKYGIL